LRLQPIPGRFDTSHFRAIHRYLFRDAYEWAGEFRKIEFSKGSSTFAPLKTPTHSLESWGEKILTSRPMREGNGRATKEFLFQLAKDAGYELEFDRVSPKTWNTAAERQTGGDDARLSREVFEKITTPSRAIAFRDEHILDAVKLFPELQGAADALDAAKRKAEAEYDAGTARLFIAKVQAQLLRRLSAGEIIQPRAASAAHDRPDDDTRTR
jgi:cell filamentation protein